jgi:hypothetical protein
MTEVKLNRNLNLVMTVESVRGPLHVFSMPLPRSIFEANFRLMARTFSSLYTDNFVAISGPKVAVLLLMEQANALEVKTEAEGLLNEMRRLTNVFAPTENGGDYEIITYYEARKKKLIDDEEAADIEGAICFFILVCRVASNYQRNSLLTGLSILWNVETTSLTLSEYQNFLQTSMTEESITQKQMELAIPQSSIPS